MILTKEEFDKIPKYISWEGKGSHMRLNRVSSLNSISYYRDGGLWGTEAFMIEDKVFSYPNEGMPWLSEKELVPCTEEEWKEDNGHYITSQKALTWEEYSKPEIDYSNKIPY